MSCQVGDVQGLYNVEKRFTDEKVVLQKLCNTRSYSLFPNYMSFRF